MPTIARAIAVIVAVLLALAAAAFLFFRSPMSADVIYQTANAVGLDAAPPEHHVVPDDFQGWAVVHFAVEGAPPLREEDDALIIEYPSSGRLDTSTPPPETEGFLQRGYYRNTANGLVPLARASEIWGEFTHLAYREDGNVAGGRSAGFFVGTTNEFRATHWPVEHRRPVGAQQ
jgi:hypothetical protein